MKQLECRPLFYLVYHVTCRGMSVCSDTSSAFHVPLSNSASSVLVFLLIRSALVHTMLKSLETNVLHEPAVEHNEYNTSMQQINLLFHAVVTETGRFEECCKPFDDFLDVVVFYVNMVNCLKRNKNTITK